MKRMVAIGATIGLLAVLGCVLFPLWRWTTHDSDEVTIDNESQFAFVLCPPVPEAHVDKDLLWGLVGLIGFVSISVPLGLHVVTRERTAVQDARQFWTQRWDSTNSTDTLLRSSEEPPASPRELLRAATDQETPKEELLRATDTE